MINLNEQRDLNIYKKLLLVLSDYTDKFPATGVNSIFKKALTGGLKIICPCEEGQNILKYILNSKESIPAIVQKLLNTRFSDLPVEFQPIYKNENSGKTIAFLSRDGKIYDKVLNLLNLNLEKDAFWCNEKGEKVELIDLEIK
jgi:hypothetical protein